MNKRHLKAMAVVLSAGLVLSLAATPAYLVKAGNTNEKNDIGKVVEEKKE